MTSENPEHKALCDKVAVVIAGQPTGLRTGVLIDLLAADLSLIPAGVRRDAAVAHFTELVETLMEVYDSSPALRPQLGKTVQ
jgi:hypothetical protein